MMGDVFGNAGQPETPVHEVVLGDFYMGRHEVTVGEFKAFVAATGYRTSAECADVLAPYPSTRLVDPYTPGDEPRILRGGSMGGDARSVRVFSRFCFGRADHCGNSGFRIARTAECTR